MNRVAVTSSTILSIGYDGTSLTLEVEFQDGAIYQYFDIPQNTYDAFIAAASPGGFLASEIKGRFRYARV
jgi:hypothetical protein